MEVEDGRSAMVRQQLEWMERDRSGLGRWATRKASGCLGLSNLETTSLSGGTTRMDISQIILARQIIVLNFFFISTIRTQIRRNSSRN